MVCQMISILHKVDMKPLGLLCIIVISCAKQVDRQAVVEKAVNLWNIEVIPHPKIYEDILIFIKHEQSVLKASDHIGHLRGQLGQI